MAYKVSPRDQHQPSAADARGDVEVLVHLLACDLDVVTWTDDRAAVLAGEDDSDELLAGGIARRVDVRDVDNGR